MNNDIDFLESLKLQPGNIFIGASDEVGRGPLAGPVVASTVLVVIKGQSGLAELEGFLSSIQELGVTDSKKLSAKKRLKILGSLEIELESLKKSVKYTLFKGQNLTVSFVISEISAGKIDEINILNASLLAMSRSFELTLKDIDVERGRWFVDGNKIPPAPVVDKRIDTEFVIKGDSKLSLIGLSSIIAKEYRDHLMVKMGELYPGYGLEKHAGYPTKAHKEKLLISGITPIHRKTFKGVKECIHITSVASS